jgi:hypothetical protein
MQYMQTTINSLVQDHLMLKNQLLIGQATTANLTIQIFSLQSTINIQATQISDLQAILNTANLTSQVSSLQSTITNQAMQIYTLQTYSKHKH